LKRYRVLIIGDSPTSQTGFARLTNEIGKYLFSKGWDVACYGMNYFGLPHDLEYLKNRIYPMHIGMHTVLERELPDIILMISDLWNCRSWRAELAGYNQALPVAQTPTAIYFPIDGRHMSPLHAGYLPLFDGVATYSQFAKTQIEDSAAIVNGDFKEELLQVCREMEIIPHGVNTDQFYPIPRGEARLLLSGMMNSSKPLADDLFIVLNANRNQPRKRLDLTIKAFAKFLALLSIEQRERCRLWLHCDFNDIDGYKRLDIIFREHCADHGVNPETRPDAEGKVQGLLVTTDPKLRIATALSGEGGVSSGVLNLIYNCANVGINTSAGEGWGMVTHEHAACAVPQIVPLNSVSHEIWGESVLYAKTRASLNDVTTGILHGICDADEAARHLFDLYRDYPYAVELGAAAFSVATDPRFAWKAIGQRFDSFLRRTIEDEGKRDARAQRGKTIDGPIDAAAPTVAPTVAPEAAISA
jgi:D-inositol-3-phosphate glycosyltransferase